MNASAAWRYFSIPAAVLLAAAICRGAEPAGDEPGALLKQAVGEVLAVSNSPNATPASVHDGVRPLLKKYADPVLMTRRAIGPAWREFTAAQQERAVTLFADIALGTYADKFTPGLHPFIVYHGAVELSPNRREVPMTMTTEDGQPLEAVFRFEHTAAGWRIYDIVVEGVSLIANYRSQFDSIFQKSGAGGVLLALETKAAETPARP
jgi:phospholipid transport system substrate-binding protein